MLHGNATCNAGDKLLVAAMVGKLRRLGNRRMTSLDLENRRCTPAANA
jgi:hypothetical protein